MSVRLLYAGIKQSGVIPKEGLLLADADEPHPLVYGICILTNYRILLACGSLGLRAISLLHPELAATEAANVRDVCSVVYETRIQTLILLVWGPRTFDEGSDSSYFLVLLREDINDLYWAETTRHNTNIAVVRRSTDAMLSSCDGRVFVGEYGGVGLNVFDVSEDHNVQAAGTVALEAALRGLASTRRGIETLVAIGYDSAIQLSRSSPLALLEPLAAIAFTSPPRRLIFRGEQLLVARYNSGTGSDEIVSLRTIGNQLETEEVVYSSKRKFFTAMPKIEITNWAIDPAVDRLLLADRMTGNVLIYKFTQEL